MRIHINIFYPPRKQLSYKSSTDVNSPGTLLRTRPRPRNRRLEVIGHFLGNFIPFPRCRGSQQHVRSLGFRAQTLHRVKGAEKDVIARAKTARMNSRNDPCTVVREQ